MFVCKDFYNAFYRRSSLRITFAHNSMNPRERNRFEVPPWPPFLYSFPSLFFIS